MPIRGQHRFLYPIDWRELSAVIRFRRSGGRCEGCGRPHGQRVVGLSDGRWWDADADAGRWQDGQGRVVRPKSGPVDLLAGVRWTRVVLAAAHRKRSLTARLRIGTRFPKVLITLATRRMQS